MANKFKRDVRDIQKRTGWAYSFCLFIVRALGYTRVSDELDNGTSSKTLNELAKEANRGS
jgi:hypothetical protein